MHCFDKRPGAHTPDVLLGCLRNLIKVTILGKPCYVLYIPIMVTYFKVLNSNPGYSWRAREGLHMWWKSPNGTDPSTAGIKIFSDAPSGQVNQLVESGRSSMTYVKTHDLTQEEGSYNYLRREWFVMYLSPQALEPTHQGCQNEAPADAQTAQVVMRPEFYERKVEKTDLWVSVIGEAGGAFGLAQTAFFGLYLLLWYTQYGAQRLEEKVHNHTHSAQADLEAAKTAAPQPRMAGASESKLSEDEAFALGVERADI